MVGRRERHPMPTVEERLAFLEGRLEDHTAAVAAIQRDTGDLRSQVHNLDQKVDRLFSSLDSRISSLDQKVDRLFYSLDSKISRHFIWIVGIQVAFFLAIVGALVRH